MAAYGIEVVLAVGALVAIMAYLIVYLMKAGAFRGKPKVWEGTPPLRNVTIMYKIGHGDYKNSTKVFSELHKLVPDEDALGIYYDDPTEVAAESLRWAVGAIIAEGVEKVDQKVQKVLEDAGFKRHELPSVDMALQSEWVIGNRLTFFFLWHVHTAMSKYLEEHNVTNIGLAVEVYYDDRVTFMFPLDHLTGFYLPGIKDKEQ